MPRAYHRANTDGFLWTECWCGRCIIEVSELEVREGLTRPCYAAGCTDLDAWGRYRYRKDHPATAWIGAPQEPVPFRVESRPTPQAPRRPAVDRAPVL